MEKMHKKSIDVRNFPRLKGKCRYRFGPEEQGVSLGCEKTPFTT